MEKRRGRAWSFVGYPNDSLPKNYLSIVESWHIPTLISPIHDKDINADLTEKKKHIHFLLVFDGMKSYNQLLEYSNQLNATIPILVDNSNGMIRYFIHADNPEKAQYSISDLIAISGFDYSNAFDCKANDFKMMSMIESVCKDHSLNNFYLLVEWLKLNEMYDVVQWLQLHTNTYIKFYLQQKYLYENSKIRIDK